MIPYVHIEVFHFGPVSLPSFIAMVGLGTLIGCAVSIVRARRLGLSATRMEELCAWILVMTYLGAHAAGWLYRPASASILFEQPWLFFSAGLASFGGFAGALAAVILFFWRRRVPTMDRWKYADAIAFALPFAWLIGRVGCALVHDHPGARSMSWLAVRYPDGPRYDLGLLEVFFLAGMCAVFLLLDRRQYSRGFFFGGFFLPYGIFRLLIEPLRIDPPRYFGWTVDQYAASAAVCLGIWALVSFHRALRMLAREIDLR